MIKILYVRAPSDLQRGQVEIKYCLPSTVFLGSKGGCERSRHLPSTGVLGAGYGQGQSTAVLSKGRIIASPGAAAAAPLPVWSTSLSLWLQHFHPWYKAVCEWYCTGWGNHSLPSLSLPLPCCGFLFLGSYIVLSLEPNMVSVTSVRFWCIIFPLSLEWGAIVSS